MAAPREGDGGDAAMVQTAVEEFIDSHGTGDGPDLALFVSRYPEHLRPRIFTQCREFLAFDGFVGKQEWEPAAIATPAGRAFGDFVIKEELGRGGMGIVYLAHQRSLNRRVALKVMASGLTLSKRHVERFRREAAAAAQVRHPGIVPVHSFTEVDGTFAFAMDYIAGRNLGDILDDLRLANGNDPAAIEGTLGMQPEKGYVAECALLCAQLASALGAAHKAGIAHRDLKPRNVMLDENRQARLLDFGLAKSLDQGSISVSGEITGTVHYMSPEQTLAKRVAVDHRTDIFSLGVILYELLTQKRPFDGRNMQQVVYEICFKEPVPIHKRNGKVPRDLVTICGKALEKDPQNRYQTAAEFEADLLRFLRWEPIHARPAGPLVRLGKWVQRHRTGAIAAGLLLAAACVAMGYAWFAAAENRRQAELLLSQAETDARNHDFDQAVRKAAEAARLLPDEDGVVGKAELYQTQQIADVRAKEARRADAYRLIGESQKALRRDPQLGLLLALEAVKLEDAPKSRSAVLDALRSGFVTKTLGGHDKGLYQARFSPDGRYVVTTGRDDPIALIWDPASGQRVAALTGHNGWTIDAMFQPGGNLIATVSQDQTCKLWRVPDGALVGTLPHRGAVEIVDWSADGRRLLTVCNEKQFAALVWDVQGQRPLAELTGHANSVQLARLSPDGRHAVTSGDSGFLRVFDVDTGGEVAQLRGHKTVTAIAFHAESQWLCTADAAGSARVFEIPSGLLLRAVQHSDRITSVCFGAGDRLLTASNDKTARLWDLGLRGEEHGELRAPRELRTFTGHGGVVASARFDASAQLVVTADEDRRVVVFDALTGAELARLDLPGTAKSAEFDPHGRVLALPRGQRAGAVVWDFTDTNGTVTMRHDQFVRAAFVADPHLVTVCEDGTVSTWKQPNGLFVGSFALQLGEAVHAADLDPAGERLAIGTARGKVAIFARKTERLLFQLDGHRDRVRTVAFARDGRLLVTCSDDHTVCVWNSLDASCMLRKELEQPVLACALSADGTVLATVEAGATAARLWTIADGSARGTTGAHQGQVTWVGFRPTVDTAVLTTSVDRGWQLTDLAGRRLAAGTADRPLDRAAFAADGLRLLTAGSSTNHAVQLWELRTDGQPSTPTLTFTDHLAAIVSGTFTGDGSQVLTGSRDRTVRLWPTDPVGLARSLPLRALTPDEIAEIVAVSAAPTGTK